MMTNLSEAPFDFAGTIQALEGDSVVLSRLRELGFIRGERVRVWGRTPFGDPILVEIRGVTVALRKQEARCILV